VLLIAAGLDLLFGRRSTWGALLAALLALAVLVGALCVGLIIVRAPQGVGARIQVEGGLGGVIVNGTFPKSDDTYTSPGYAAAENRADVRVNGGVGQLTIQQMPGE
jgi:hypothetical protein